MNILLIGGTGVLSSAVTKEALRKGIEVTMINRGKSSSSTPNGVEVIISDHKSYDYIREVLSGRHFDAVIDFLCYTEKDTKDSFLLYKDFTSQYFYISSCAVYDTRVGEICKEESKKILPIWKYSVNKWESEKRIIELAKDANVNYTIIRPSVTYGDTRIPYGISPKYKYHWTLAARILAEKPIIRWNGGTNKCNITRVEDFAVGVVGLIGNEKAFNEAFNVCGDETPSFNDVLNSMAEYLGKEPIVFDLTSEEYATEIPYRKGELLGGRSIDAINSNDKIKEAVPSFHQTIYLKEGIRLTLDAYKHNNYQQGIDWFFDGETDRIINKYAKQRKLQFNTDFVDYLSNASIKDKRIYWLEKHKDISIVKMYVIVVTFVKNVITHYKYRYSLRNGK